MECLILERNHGTDYLDSLKLFIYVSSQEVVGRVVYNHIVTCIMEGSISQHNKVIHIDNTSVISYVEIIHSFCTSGLFWGLNMT